MSVNDLDMELEDAARAALFETTALTACEFHPEVTVNPGNYDAERHAYAIATNALKQKGQTYLREELMAAIKNELDMAAEGECPACAHLRDA